MTPAQRRASMQANRAKDTTPELLLRRALWAAGVRGYRVHAKRVPGSPDVAWIGRKLAVFIDGCFWHGCPLHGRPPSSNRGYWVPKIARNQARDAEVTEALRQAGWRVRRYWEHEVRKELARVVAEVGQLRDPGSAPLLLIRPTSRASSPRLVAEERAAYRAGSHG
jgi:DNA mismatch endonuclease (patch repair protein)